MLGVRGSRALLIKENVYHIERKNKQPLNSFVGEQMRRTKLKQTYYHYYYCWVYEITNQKLIVAAQIHKPEKRGGRVERAVSPCYYCYSRFLSFLSDYN